MRSVSSRRLLMCLLLVISVGLLGSGRQKGLNDDAFDELEDAGVFDYLGVYAPVSSEPFGDEGWVKHTFDPEAGDGPICIAGTPYSVFTREGQKANRLLIFLQGGGACWQDFYNCNVLSEDQEPPPDEFLEGIFDRDNDDNPFRKYSVVYMPYCDGSVHSGDNAVADPNFPFGPVRFHRGLRNQSAGMDVAADVFPDAKRITLAGSSAGGVGVAGFSPFLVRALYGNKVRLTVFNDAGPVAIDLSTTNDIEARAEDWDFGKFFPDSCTDCSDMGQSTEIIKWRLDNDSTIREAFYETDSDLTNRFFLGLLANQPFFRQLVVEEHGEIHDEFRRRYRRFIVAGDTSHTALQTPLFYTQTADGVSLRKWTRDFLKARFSGWKDIVEDPAP